MACFSANPAPRQNPSPAPSGGVTVCSNCFQEGLDAQASGDLPRALAAFESGCGEQNGAACDAAARMLSQGQGAPEDDARAIDLYIRACNLGHAKACNDLGSALVVVEDPARAAAGRTLLARGCEAGNALACHNLGIAHLQGHGGPVDLQAAARMWARSCELGFAAGCTSYAVALLAGEGVAADPQKARDLLTRTCQAGDARGCGRLGIALRDGLGGPVDATGANGYLQRSCDGGYQPACLDLGVALYRGAGGLEVDVPRAVALFEGACKAGLKVACDNLENINAARMQPAEEKATQWSTRIGTMTIGSGSQTATFRDVRSTCGMLQLTVAFASAASPVRGCLSGTAERRISLAVEAGRVTSSSVDPDDGMGRCVTDAMAGAYLGTLTCTLEASVSR